MTRVRVRQTDGFVSTKTPLYRATHDAIVKLRKAEGTNRTQRCIAEASTEATYNAFATRYGLRLASRPCIHRLLGQRCPGDEDLPPKCRDHAHLWTRHGHAAVFTIEPYEQDGGDVAACSAWADENGLLMLVSATSGHFYGVTLWIELWRKDVYEIASKHQNSDE